MKKACPREVVVEREICSSHSKWRCLRKSGSTLSMQRSVYLRHRFVRVPRPIPSESPWSCTGVSIFLDIGGVGLGRDCAIGGSSCGERPATRSNSSLEFQIQLI